LTEWTRKFEEKFGDLTKLVDRRFNALDSLVKGLEERFDAMHRRQNKTERLTATRFEEVKERIDQLDNRLNHSKTETQARLEELTTRINDQCQRPAATASPDSSSSFRPTTTPLASTRSFIQSFNPDDYFLIQRHNFLDKNAFKHKLWDDYKNEFGDGVNEYWFGLQRLHDLMKKFKKGSWHLKIFVNFDIDKYGKPSRRRGPHYIYWEDFYVASEEEGFKLSLGLAAYSYHLPDYGPNPMDKSKGMKFSTEDRNNDGNCARSFGGGWWHGHEKCFSVCLNCQRDLAVAQGQGLFYDGIDEIPSESKMWARYID